jgi:hypothetical protein
MARPPGGEQLDDVAGIEVTGHAVHPGGEQRAATAADGLDRAVVEVEGPTDVGGVPQPEPAGTHPGPGGAEHGADLRAVLGGGQGIGDPVGGGQQHRDPGRRRHRGRLDLGGHAAGAQSRPGAGDADPRELGRVVDLGDQRRPEVARVAVVEAVDVGEQHERVGADDVRDERGEPVVVAHPDLGGGDGVVLVDHRKRPELQQPLQGALGVAVVRAADHVVGGEQHLPDALPVPGERRRVGVGEQQLPDRRGGLLGRQVTRPASQLQRREAGRDRPRGDEHDLRTGGATPHQGVDQGVEPGRVETTGQARQRRRPDLHHDPLRRTQCGARAHAGLTPRSRGPTSSGRPRRARRRTGGSGARPGRACARRRRPGRCPPAGCRCRAR